MHCLPLSDYTLVSPYKDVDWSSRKAYKTGLHTHSSVSDGSETFRNMIYAAYEQNYDILSFSEHGITGRAWDKTPFIRPLYLYSYLLGYDKKPLTPEEFAAVTDGSAALESTGEARGRGQQLVGEQIDAFGVEFAFFIVPYRTGPVAGVVDMRYTAVLLDQRKRVIVAVLKAPIQYNRQGVG